jgi:hypothetical protein
VKFSCPTVFAIEPLRGFPMMTMQSGSRDEADTLTPAWKSKFFSRSDHGPFVFLKAT